jgi:Domain of unknown function (DUF222)
MEFATDVAKRLPKTFAALAAGLIHPIHLRIIEEATRYLADADAAKADAFLAAAAPGMTFGELRYAARKLVLKLDPDIARKRKEAAKREAYVRRFQEESGNAGMVARELPSDEVLASWQHVEQRALDLRAAGAPGTLQDLRVRAYLDLLQERDSRVAVGLDQPAPASLPQTSRPRTPARPVPAPAPDSAPTALTALTVPAAVLTVPAPLPVPAPRPGRAWPPWSPSPSPWPPTRAAPMPPARPAGSGSSTATTPATWPPPRPGTLAPGGA